MASSKDMADLYDSRPAFMSRSSGFIHVYPTFGREHVIAVECWCCPKPLTDQPSVYVHEADN